MYKVQAEGGNQLSADHKQILLRGWGGFPPISATTKNGGISVNGVFEHFPYLVRFHCVLAMIRKSAVGSSY